MGTYLFTFAVERAKIREFAMAIGDANPLYLDHRVARAAGYRDVVAPPTFATAIDRWGHTDIIALCAMLGLDPLRTLHGEQEYEYHAPICAGDVLSATVRIVERSKRRGRSGSILLVRVDTSYTNQNGEHVMSARAVWIERG